MKKLFEKLVVGEKFYKIINYSNNKKNISEYVEIIDIDFQKLRFLFSYFDRKEIKLKHRVYTNSDLENIKFIKNVPGINYITIFNIFIFLVLLIILILYSFNF